MTDSPGLERRLGPWDATSVVVSGVIGSAVFLIPSTLFQLNGSPLAAMLLLCFGGLVSYFGALAYAELAAMFPETGGDYRYLRQTWGPLWGFLCGWAFFLVIQTGGLAALVVGFASLLSSLVPMSMPLQKTAAAGLFAGLTVINYCGVRTGATFGNVFTVLKLGGIGVMAFAVLTRPAAVSINWAWPESWTPYQFAAGLIPVLWAFEGWNMAPCLGGEIRDPRRNLPRALAMGLALVVVVYALSLWMYLRVLTVSEMIASQKVAADAALRALGPAGGSLVTLTMIAAVVGCSNTCVLGAARVSYAMARDGIFFKAFGRVHPRFHTPHIALLAQCAWGVVLTLSGSYELLFSYTTFGAWIFYTMIVAGVIRLRQREPDRPRAFRMWGYPWTALIFSTIGAAFVFSCLLTAPLPSIAGLALIASGIPLYFFWRRRNPQQMMLEDSTSSKC